MREITSSSELKGDNETSSIIDYHDKNCCTSYARTVEFFIKYNRLQLTLRTPITLLRMKPSYTMEESVSATLISTPVSLSLS